MSNPEQKGAMRVTLDQVMTAAPGAAKAFIRGGKGLHYERFDLKIFPSHEDDPERGLVLLATRQDGTEVSEHYSPDSVWGAGLLRFYRLIEGGA